MAPKRAAHADAPSHEPQDSFIPLFTTYDGSPLNKATFFVEGRRCLFKHVTAAREYVTYGIQVSSRATSFYSLKHIQDHLDGSIVKGTLTTLVDFRAKYVAAAAAAVPQSVTTPAVLNADGTVKTPAVTATVDVVPTRVADFFRPPRGAHASG